MESLKWKKQADRGIEKEWNYIMPSIKPIKYFTIKVNANKTRYFPSIWKCILSNWCLNE